MFTKTLIACAVALPLALIGAAPAALAHTDVNIRLGVPFYAHQVAPHYRYYRGYGWYDPYRYPRFHGGGYYDDGDDYAAAYPARLSCGEAAERVREHGFYRVRPRDCDGHNYAFDGVRRGHWSTIFVNSFTGRVWRE